MPKPVRMRLKGVRDVRRNLFKASKRATRAIGEGNYEIAVRVMDKSQRQTPKDTGELRRTGFITEPSPVEGEVTFGYGATYAAFVHDDDNTLQAQHAAPTKRQFLSDPIKEFQVGFVKKLARAARKHFKHRTKAKRGKYPSYPRLERKTVLKKSKLTSRNSKRAKSRRSKSR